jgi:predicted nucleic acid-binding protein
MAAKLTDITKYTPKSSDLFFFDNNIWMYLFCPLANYNKNKQKHYSSFLQSIATSRSTIFISSMVLSEFSNRNLRMDFDLWKDETGNHSAEFKKDYVGTSRYRDTVDEIKISINNIMKFCEKTSDNFNAIDLKDVLTHLSHIDFNDSYYLEQAKIGTLKIVTDDSDFSTYTNHNVEIITLLN